MGQAIFGLVGVIIGGIITAGFQVFMQRKQRTRDLRVAARILDDELRWWWTDLNGIANTGKVTKGLPGYEEAKVREVWRAYREAFAELSRADWHALHVAVRNSNFDVLLKSWPSDEPLAESIAASVQETMSRIERARSVLEKVAD